MTLANKVQKAGVVGAGGGGFPAHVKLAGKAGVLVSSVDPGGPAGKAGMKAGDVVLKLDTQAIQDGDDLLRQGIDPTSLR